MQRYRYRQWLLLFGLLLGCLLGLLGLFNYLVDPLWCFSHGCHLGKLRFPINERQQKTNHLTFARQPGYDAVILGNSRTALINQHDLAGMRAYNYAVAGMTPYEYSDYLDYFKETAGRPSTVLLGLGFSNTIAGVVYNAEKPRQYIEQATSPFYRYRTLFTADTLQYSWRNLRVRQFLEGRKRWAGHMFYDHANVVTLVPPDDTATAELKMQEALKELAASYGAKYRYRDDLKGALLQLRADNPGTRFLAFTNPVTERYYCTLVRAGRLPEYERWLREMVEVFGQVWHFEYPHSIARDPANFSDDHHFYPRVGTLIAHRLTGVDDPKIPEDFGLLLTPQSIDADLARIREAGAACRQESTVQ